MDRRDFLTRTGVVVAGALAGGSRPDVWFRQEADYTVRIAPFKVELAPGTVIHTTAFNGQVPGPLMRWRAGRPIVVDVANETDTNDWVHWHGLIIPSAVDGSGEEGTSTVAARTTRRYAFTPEPSGFRWYHSHRRAGHDLSVSTYSGEFGFLMIDDGLDAGRYDQEIFLALHDWDAFHTGGDDGFWSVAYNHASINDRKLGFGDPVRVRKGDRLLVHLLNASATDVHWIALPGHRFTVTALDGNTVPVPTSVATLRLGPAERVDAVVTMDNPGVWVLGECHDGPRSLGMGVVVEYAGQSGPARWVPPAALVWDYTAFGRALAADHSPGRAGGESDAELIPMEFRSSFHGHGDFEHWTVNGDEFPKGKPIVLTAGRRYRLRFINHTTEDHPVHLHRHRFELVVLDGTPTAGVVKDVVIVPAGTTTEVEFTASAPGKTLFHCHMQEHMDFGFMKLFDYA